MIPPGLDLTPFTPVPPSDSPRPLVVHAPSNREKKGTRWVIEACEQLDVELDIVEGVPHDVARERYARADIVVDQLNAGWHGVFALESMALGKPVVTYLKPDVVERSAEGYGIRLPVVPATKETLVDVLRPLVEQPGAPPRARGREPRLRRAGARHRPRHRPPGRPLPFAIEVSMTSPSRSGGWRATPRSTGSAGSSRASSRCCCCRSTPRTSARRASARSRQSRRSRPCS